MGRQSKKQAIPATDLFNFHFRTAAVPLEASVSRNNFYRSRTENQNFSRNAQDRASARKKANTAFFSLHSSPDYAFILTRRSHSKVQGDSSYTFSGCDSPVSWESIRIVKHFVPLEDGREISCPICLSDFVCPRITKCGHSYCLSCIVHHVQSHAASNVYSDVSCPCCSLPLALCDLRPVIIQQTLPPKPQDVIQLRKLHRHKGCSAPYLPLPKEPLHCSPHTAPSQSDPDAAYCRFNYVDPFLFRSLLEDNRASLLQEMKVMPPSSSDYAFLQMSLEMVLRQEARAVQEIQEELELHKRFIGASSGMYERQSLALIYDPKKVVTVQDSGESVSLFHSAESSSSSKPSNNNKLSEADVRSKQTESGSMYLEDRDSTLLYQAEDGQLVFLNALNIACLSVDYARNRRVQEPCKPPLPDFVSGRILEIKNVYLTEDIRKTSPFLQHLPLFIEISVVELELRSIISDEAKKKFQVDISKRRKKRQSKAMTEKRADRNAQREQERLINERRARYRTIDPNDNFFQSSTTSGDIRVPETEPVLGSVKIRAGPLAVQSYGAVARQSFSAACRHQTDALHLRSEESFPGLQRVAESLSGLDLAHNPSRKEEVKVHSEVVAENKRSKGKKIRLFSTGGQRVYN